MEKVVLKATKRTVTGKQVSQLRRAGQLPAVIYGHEIGSIPISLEAHSAGQSIPKLTSSSIINVELDGKLIPALVREKQKNYIKNVLIHVDFQAVSLTEKIRAAVMIHFSGLAPAIADYSAIVVHNLNKLEVEALPQDLPERIEVDLSGLAKIGNAIHVRDLSIPEAVTVLSDPDIMVAVATATKEEAVEVVAAPTAEVAAPEIIEKGKKEEDGEEEK
ncbi:MAG: 50S ribosomal protein L25 [Anaerolineales bacterium]